MKLHTSYNQFPTPHLLHTIVVELVKTTVGDQGAETDTKRVKYLSCGGHPHISVSELAKIRLNVINDTLRGSGQRDSAEKQNDENQVRKSGGKVDNFSRRLYPLPQTEIDQDPGKKEAYHELPT